MAIDLKARIRTSVFAFRGYNVTNQGRSAELLAHPAYAPVVSDSLRNASELCAEATGKKIDLVHRVQAGLKTRLSTFAEDVAMIVAMEIAQIRLLEQFHDCDYQQTRMAFGYSLGEPSALVCGGCFGVETMLPPLLSMAGDSAELARDVRMGVVFSRDVELDLAAVERLCLEINQRGHGVVAISAYLSPNTVLILGQRATVERFRKQMGEELGPSVHLRKNEHHWPPLHTPILWERNIPNRAGLMMHALPGGLTAPDPPVVSLATGKAEYNDVNARELLNRWIDHPQRLWDAVYETLAAGVDTVVHVGPEPNLIPATFRRISENVKAQLSGRSPKSLGLRAVSTIWRPWLAKWLSSRSALLRAPFIEHIMLEDWLLEQEVA